MVKKIFSASVESGLTNILNKLRQTNLEGKVVLAREDHFDFDSLKVLEFQEKTEKVDIDEILNSKKGPLTLQLLTGKQNEQLKG